MRKSASRRNFESMTSPDSIHPQNARLLDDLRGRYYFAAAEKIFLRLVESRGVLRAGDYLSEAMRSMLPRVNALLRERKNRGEIRDENQARKSIAGNVFQALVARALIEMQAGGLIPGAFDFRAQTQKPPENPRQRDDTCRRRIVAPRFGFAGVFGIVAPRNNLRLFAENLVARARRAKPPLETAIRHRHRAQFRLD